MNLKLRAKFLAGVLMLGSASFIASEAFSPAQAAHADINFRYFHNRLSRAGDWVYSDRWGEVWLPAYVDDDWRPYSNGYWADIEEYGWLWVSDDDEFGDITSHYGRWVNDPYDGWMWIPGYVWSPAWVVWRRSGDYTGWMPMPPDQQFLRGEEFGGVSVGLSVGGLSISFNNWGNTNSYYGYSRWYGRNYSPDRFNAMWTFVPVRHFADRNYRRYEAPRRSIPNFVRTSINITNYTVVNNYIVNRSVSEKSFRDVDLKSFRRVRAADVVRQPALIAPVDRGRELQLRMRREMPRGNGLASSAPKPTATQVQSLSVPTDAKAQQRAERRASRLMTRDAASAVARPDGSVPTPLPPASNIKVKDRAGDQGGSNALPSNGAQTPVVPGANATDKVRDNGKKAEGNGPTGEPDAMAVAPSQKNKGKTSTQSNDTSAAGDTPAPAPHHMRAHPAREAGPITAVPDNGAAEPKKTRARADEGTADATAGATPDTTGANDEQATQPAASEPDQSGKKKMMKKQPKPESETPADEPH